ncbi:MAG: hypothetical protein WKG01_27130 [Kofleriaceae bacterium]
MAKSTPKAKLQPAKPKPEPKPPTPRPSKPRKPAAKPGLAQLATIASGDFALSLLIGDSKIVAGWRGAGDDPDDSDLERARRALAKREAAMVDVGRELALALTLAVGHGSLHIYQLDDRTILVETLAGDLADPQYLAWVASAPEKKTRSAAMLAAPSGTLTIVALADDGKTGFSLVAPPKVAVAIEPPAAGAWGSGRRCFITRA